MTEQETIKAIEDIELETNNLIANNEKLIKIINQQRKDVKKTYCISMVFIFCFSIVILFIY